MITAAFPKKRTLPVRPLLRLRKILVPVDFSPPSQKALEYAIDFARQVGGELTLLHVLKPLATPAFPDLGAAPAFSEQQLVEAESDLRELAARANAAGVAHATCDMRMGFATNEIVDAARELESDLIVIATHGYTGLRHFCIGSTAERVVRAAPCPVFVVREKEYEFR